MLAEDLSVVDVNSLLWNAARPLLDAALRLEQNDDTYLWHGWSKQQINAFLGGLPAHCTLIIGVWNTVIDEQDQSEREVLMLGSVCEVIEGEVHSVRTFEAFVSDDLPSVEELEPGFEHAFALMRAARTRIAPVAWAVFTDKTTWDEWLFAASENGGEIDKGELLAFFARQGRCVLMGSQASQSPHHH